MFRRSVQDIRSVLNTFLRQKGLETPLLQKRLMDAWPDVVGRSVVRYTSEMFIKNQTLFVKISYWNASSSSYGIIRMLFLTMNH